MKIKQLLITGTCVAALTLCLPVAYAQSPSPSPKTKASPAAEKADKSKAETKSETASTEKKPRSLPFNGDVNEIDKDAKTFEIGKTSKRTLKVTDDTKITNNNAEASFSDITEGAYVTGSYWKKDDGTLEARTVKLGGTKKASTKKSSKKDEDKADDESEE